jgi:hypothetical protein
MCQEKGQRCTRPAKGKKNIMVHITAQGEVKRKWKKREDITAQEIRKQGPKQFRP